MATGKVSRQDSDSRKLLNNRRENEGTADDRVQRQTTNTAAADDTRVVESMPALCVVFTTELHSLLLY